jgi:flagellar biosynthesis anti-sigma factor FlgM
MVIDRIGNINNIQESNRQKSVSRSRETSRNDKVEISPEAKKASEIQTYSQMVRETTEPERAQRVQEIKARVANGTYDFDSTQVTEMVADKIASYLLRR